jgi:hypothetical protein
VSDDLRWQGVRLSRRGLLTGLVISAGAGTLNQLNFEPPNPEYDIVEPSRTRHITDVYDTTHDAAPDGSPSAGRYVPKPKYRMVFSTLRRRLGRSLNRNG